MIATSGFLAALESTKFVFGKGSAPDPTGGAYDAPPDPLVGSLLTPRRFRRLDPPAKFDKSSTVRQSRGGPPGRRTDRPTWLVPAGSQATQSGPVMAVCECACEV